MKKGYIFLIIGIFLIAIAFGVYFFRNKNNRNSGDSNFSYNSTKVSTTENNTQNDITSTNTSNTENTNNEESNNENTTDESKPQTETEIASFSTKIYTKDKERQNNINITCSSLNDTYVNNRETFSFCSTVGKATTSKGYQKADVYQYGEVVQALGGGNCQVSSTLYNAVLKVPELNVTERHEHSNSVPYVSKGKDAAVAYGSYDFKFVNNLGDKIKITASCDKDNVYIKIFKIE